MRIALFADVHGNSIALDAVLADIRTQGGVDAYWALGDLVAVGPDPVGVLERIAALPEARCTRGNQEHCLVTGEHPKPTLKGAQNDPRLWPAFVQVRRSFAWTLGALATSGWWDWLAALPLEQRALMPDGTRLLGVHSSPGRDGDPGIHPAQGEDVLRSLLGSCDADLVCVGHTHWPMETDVDGVHVVNVGSVSLPFAPDLRASYVLLEVEGAGYRVRHRRVAYDRQAVIAAAQRVQHPGADFIAQYMLGRRVPEWLYSLCHSGQRGGGHPSDGSPSEEGP
ncbi:MAG: metallophosphoesterase family protein [Anaerolineae bacterium]|nr:metallophosphoesterase family protein [Anaerolineae bacterium]